MHKRDFNKPPYAIKPLDPFPLRVYNSGRSSPHIIARRTCRVTTFYPGAPP